MSRGKTKKIGSADFHCETVHVLHPETTIVTATTVCHHYLKPWLKDVKKCTSCFYHLVHSGGSKVGARPIAPQSKK